jgi:MraZ protein
VARFVGSFEHSLDSKGRVILPAKFRAAFEHGGYLTQYHEGCLALWTPDEFERQLEAIQAGASAEPAERNLARVFSARTAEVEVDRQGRMAIPPRLRQFAGLTGDVLVIGAIERVELWDPARWEASVQPEERQFLAAST